MKKYILAAAVLAVCVSVVRADFDLTKWPYKKILGIPGGDGQFAEVVFDNDVFAHSRPDFNDIRVVQSGGSEAPYVLTTESGKSSREAIPAKIFNKGKVGTEKTVFSLDLEKEGVFHNAVEIETDSTNFRRQAVVEGSSDGENWMELSRKSIYDYSYEFKAKDTAISYQDSTLRYLRVSIFDNSEKPLKVLGASVYKQVATSGKEVVHQGTVVNETQLEKERATATTIDLGARGLPTNKVELKTDDTNFNREIFVEGSNDNASWVSVQYRDVIFSYSTPAFTGAKLTVGYPESNWRYLRLTIINKDDKPIRIAGATAYGTLRKLVFQISPGATYALYYGNQVARAPEYDLKNYLDYYAATSPRAVVLGAEEKNAAYEPPTPPVKPFSERYPGLLMTTLALAVLVIGFFIYRLLKTTPPQK